MAAVPTRTLRRAISGLTPLIFLAAVVPLLAPTCGGFEPGVKTFSKGSIIIPMDVCYQCTTDNDTGSEPASCGVSGYVTAAGTAQDGMGGGKACPQATDQGDVVKAYGLVYQLIRNGISVYWVINDRKANLDDYDLTLQYSGGPPVLFYNWNAGGTLASPVPTAASTVNYMGGVFVVDGSDFAAASALLQDGARIDKTTFSPVNIHVSNVAFQGYVKRTMAGGWDAGGTRIPKLALLDIASSGSGTKNSYVVIAGYLQKAGLTNDINNPWPLGGTTAAGNHGQIYDRLTMEDFLPRDASGNYLPGGAWTTSNFFMNSIWRPGSPTDGYVALWVPHWVAPTSCKTCTRNGNPISCSDCGTSCSCVPYGDASLPTAQRDAERALVNDALRVIGEFQAIGGDIFAECAGLGSFDSVPGNTTYTPTWLDHTHTEFQTSSAQPGFAITTTTPGAPTFRGSYPLPLMQIGDFEFVPRSGAIATYDANQYKTEGSDPGEVLRLVSEAGDKDVFTMLVGVDGGAGAVVYMGGHSYSGTDGTYGTAGTRFVLNTLFNLGATCVANGATCSTGGFGVCGRGTMTCVGNTPVCSPDHAPGELTETCNGLDDDCDGQVDEDLFLDCYTGPLNTINTATGDPYPICQKGRQFCELLPTGSYGYGACLGQQLPATELCDGLDNNCDGTPDEPIADRSCYTGPSTSKDPITGLPMGICRSGTQTCESGAWGYSGVVGACNGQITPKPREVCGPADNPIGPGNGLDDNCNGLVDEGCGCPTTPPDNQRNCYTGPADTYTEVGGVITPKGDCRVGSQLCVDGAWGACANQVLPMPEEDCGVLTAVPPGDGDADCNGVNASAEPACQFCYEQSCYEGPPDSKDPVSGLPRGLCRSGTREVCTSGEVGTCGGAQVLPAPEVCDGKDNDCDGISDDGPPACGTGLTCVNGNCVREVCGGEQRCPTGYECNTASWTCIAIPDCCPQPLEPNGTCAVATRSCDPGDRCVSHTDTSPGSCVDPCDAITCGEGTVCAGGTCTGGACYTTGCASGFTCRNGSCVLDPCNGVSCPGGTFCRQGDCVQSCAVISCLEGQVCSSDGFCIVDACHGVACNPGEICVPNLATGGHDCQPNACTGVVCGTGKVCEDGACVDDPCTAVQCASGICLPRPALDCASPPCMRAQCFSTSNPTGTGTITEPPPDESSGCGCGSGRVTPSALLLGLLLLPLARRRRAQGGARGLLALGLAVGLTATLAGCPSKDETTEEASTCGAEGCNAQAVVAPFIQSVSPASGLKGSPKQVDVILTGARFQDGATVRIWPTGEATVVSTSWQSASQLQVRLDLSAAAFGSYLLRVVNADNVISNLGAFDAVAMAPTVASVVNQTTGNNIINAPDVAILTVTGSNFTPASECWVKVGSYSVPLDSPHLFDSTKDDKLVCTLDTSKVSSASELWVVNEGGIASATRLPIVVNAPLTLSAISPPAAQAGTTAVISLYGSGFDNTCGVEVANEETPTVWTAVPAAKVTFYGAVPPSYLKAEFVTRSTAGGQLLRVTKPSFSPTASQRLTVVTTSSTVSVDSLAPQSGTQGSTVVFTFGGSGLLGTERMELLPPAGTWQDVGVVSGSGTTVTRSVDFSSTATWPAGDYQARLKFADLSVSGTFPFALVSNTPTLWSFTATPVAPATVARQQGTTDDVTVTGTNFLPGVTLQLIGPAGFTPRTPASIVYSHPSTTVAGNGLSLVGMDTGVYSLVARNTTSGNSNPLTFNVVPGLPTLTTIAAVPGTAAPACTVQSGTPVTVTLTGTNLAKPDALGAGGSIVLVRNPGLGIPNPLDATQSMALPSDRVTVVNHTTIQISFDTSTAIRSDAYPNGYDPAVCLAGMPCRCTPSAPCPYKIKVSNPGSTPLVSGELDLYVKAACP